MLHVVIKALRWICSELERRMLQETEKRNRDFATRMREQREELKKLTESHLEELTKRTILENEQMSAELQYESRQVCPHITLNLCMLW